MSTSKQFLALSLGLTLCATSAHASGWMSNGFVVPNTIHNGDSDTTVVGLVNASGDTVRVFWTFFDQNGQPSDKGCFVMPDKRSRPFIWSSVASAGNQGKRGYLVFAVANKYPVLPNVCGLTGPGLAPISATLRSSAKVNGNAFQVNLASSDVAFLPVISGSLSLKTADADIATMAPDTLVDVGGAPYATTKHSLRYYINGAAGGDDTGLLMWSTADMRGTHLVAVYNDASDSTSVAMTLSSSRQNWVNVESLPGLPAAYRDGFIEWNPTVTPADFGALGGTAGQSLGALSANRPVFTYSVISAPAFGAVQTLLGFYGY